MKQLLPPDKLCQQVQKKMSIFNGEIPQNIQLMILQRIRASEMTLSEHHQAQLAHIDEFYLRCLASYIHDPDGQKYKAKCEKRAAQLERQRVLREQRISERERRRAQ